MANWKKVGKTETESGTIITYESELPGIKIESRLRHIPHANGVGTWEHTSYFVVTDDGTAKERWTLKDAKKMAEEIAAASGG